MPAPLKLGEHSPIKAHGYDRERKLTPKGKRAEQWRARAKFRGRDGKVHDLTRWADTKDAAVQAVRDAIEDRSRSGSVTPLRPGMPFVEAGAYWLSQIERPEFQLSARTRADYAGHYRRSIDCAGSPLRGLTLAEANSIQVLVSYFQEVADSRGSQTAKQVRSVVSSILKLAVARGVLDINAARGTGISRAMVEAPTPYNRDRAMTKAERDHAVATADRMAKVATNSRTVRKFETVADVMAFMAGTGCRITEARTMVWADIDLKAMTAHLRGTKNATSDRMVHLPAWLVTRLQTRRAAMVLTAQEVRSAFKLPGKVSEPFGPYVFGYVAQEIVTEDGQRSIPGTNRPMDQSNLANAVRDVLDAAGLEWAVPHSFRRTVASLLHEQGVPLVRIADQLGHKDPTTTARIYLGRDFGGDKSDLAALL